MNTSCCKVCNRRISSLNTRNLKCQDCSHYFHPNCSRFLPPICVRRNGKYRYKVVRNQTWVCDYCTLSRLPFYDLTDLQLREICVNQTNDRKRVSLPSANQMNSMFVNTVSEKDNEFDSSYFSNKAKYLETSDIEVLSFSGDSDFPIISLNIRSIVNSNNFAKFEAFLDSLPVKPLVIGLNETWITDLSQGPYSCVPGYNFIHNNRSKHPGGGVAFYIADHLHFNQIDSLCVMKEKVFESLFVEIDVNGKKLVCGSIYRSPSVRFKHDVFLNNLKDVLDICSKQYASTIIMGDLNYDLLSLEDIHVGSCVDMFFEYSFFPLINIPTRITETSGNALDHFWTNIVEMPVQCAVILDPVSDHLPIYMNLCTEENNEKDIYN